MTRKDYRLVAALLETRPPVMPMIQTPAFDKWEEIVRAIGAALNFDNRFYAAVGITK